MLLVACTTLAYVLPQSPALRTPLPQSRAGAPAVMQAKPEAVKSPDGSSPRSVGGHGSEAGITQPPRYALQRRAPEESTTLCSPAQLPSLRHLFGLGQSLKQLMR